MRTSSETELAPNLEANVARWYLTALRLRTLGYVSTVVTACALVTRSHGAISGVALMLTIGAYLGGLLGSYAVASLDDNRERLTEGSEYEDSASLMQAASIFYSYRLFARACAVLEVGQRGQLQVHMWMIVAGGLLAAAVVILDVL